jgi:hypothetical protein
MKVYDTWNNSKEVSKSKEQFDIANKLYPERFLTSKPQTDLPKKKKEKKEAEEAE